MANRQTHGNNDFDRGGRQGRRTALASLRSIRGGVNRVVAILLALIAVMLVIIAIPWWQHFRERSEIIACEQAMKSAKDGLIIEYLGRFKEGSTNEAMKTLDQVMVARPNICPSAGEVYLIRNSQGIFEPHCGLHDPDEKLRTRLNASRALELLREGRRLALRENGGKEPEAVEIQLNCQKLSCVRVKKAQKLRRGTATTDDFEGVVAFYGLAGEGDFPVEDVAEGDIFYFVYADEDHCAIWRANDGWTGDAYRVQ